MAETEVALVAVYVGLVLLAAKVLEDLARRAKLPGFIGAILAGYILGPGGLNIISEEYVKAMGLLLVVGIDFLLFLAGTEELSKMRGGFGPREVAIAGVLLASTTAATALISHLAYRELPWTTDLAFGIVMGIVSLGPLTRALIDSGLIATQAGLMVTRIGLMAEVGGILAFNAVYAGKIFPNAITTPLFFAAIYLFGRKLLTRLLYIIEDYISAREAPFAVIVALVLTASYVAELLGFNAAVTALLLGFFASSYLEERPAYIERLKAFTYGFLEPLFFAGIGLKAPHLDPTSLALTGIITIAAAAPKLLTAAAAGLMPTGIALLAKGGVDAALLLTLYETPHGASEHMIPSQLYTAGVFSMLILSVLMALGLRSVQAPARREEKEPWRMRIGELGLGYDVVRRTDNLLTVSMFLSASQSGAVVVIDEEGRPIGYITAADLIYISPSDMKRLTAEEVMRYNVPIVRVTDRVIDLLREHLMAEPIVAVVDHDGRLVGTISPHRVLQKLYGLGREKKH